MGPHNFAWLQDDPYLVFGGRSLRALQFSSAVLNISNKSTTLYPRAQESHEQIFALYHPNALRNQ
jgi:hypothetical protein